METHTDSQTRVLDLMRRANPEMQEAMAELITHVSPYSSVFVREIAYMAQLELSVFDTSDGRVERPSLPV